jgi:CheY-like chemotaxis protein
MSEKYRILVVDDNSVNRVLLRNILEKEGFEAILAESGEECLQIVSMENVDLILLDVQMPGIDGFETCKLLKENEVTAEIPVVFVTALDQRNDILKGYKIGGVDYIPKPFDRMIVIARVRALLTIQGLLSERTNLLNINSVLLGKIEQMFSGEQVSIFAKLDIIKDEMGNASENFFDKLDKLRSTISDKTSLSFLDQIEMSMQIWDRLNQQVNEVSKGIHQLHSKIKERDNGQYNLEQIEQQSTETVFLEKTDQDDIDALLAKFG